MDKELFNKLKDNAELKTAVSGAEGRALKNALENHAEEVEEMRSAVFSGDMEKAKGILSAFMSDEKNAKIVKELEKLLKGRMNP